MKKTFVIILLIAAILASSVHAQAIKQGVSVQVTLLNQDPDPVQPGDIVELRFKVENNGSTALQNVALELLPEYPFTILDAPVKEIGNLGAAQSGSEGVIVKYRVQVAPNAADGTFNIDARYRNGDAWVRVENFNVNIQKPQTELVLNQIQVSPSIIEPGEVANLTIAVENSGSKKVNEVKLKLDFSDTTLPFAPFGTSNEFTIGELPGNTQRNVVFSIIAKPDALADLYKMPIILTYKDLNNNKFNKSTVTGLRVGSKPDILVLVDKSDIMAKTGSGTVSIKVVNKGLTNLRFVVVSLLPSADFDLISSKDIYLGKLDSDDYSTADFKIQVKKKSDNQVDLPLHIEFRDSSNQLYQQDVTANLHLLSDSEAAQLGLKTGGNITWLLVFAVIVIIGIWYFLVRKRKGKAKQ